MNANNKHTIVLDVIGSLNRTLLNILNTNTPTTNPTNLDNHKPPLLYSTIQPTDLMNIKLIGIEANIIRIGYFSFQ